MRRAGDRARPGPTGRRLGGRVTQLGGLPMGARPAGPVVYAAHPVTTYGTDLERTALARLAELLPGATVIDPCDRYRDAEHWLEDWPALLPTLSALIVFGAPDATVGTGCLHELADAWWCGMPVAMLDRAGALRHLVGLRMIADADRDRFRTATLVPGQPMDLAPLIGLSDAGDQP